MRSGGSPNAEKAMRIISTSSTIWLYKAPGGPPMKTELESFNDIWERENAKTIKLLESLPVDAYDFRPDPEGRSLGEMAWHLAEPEAFGSFAIENGAFAREPKPPGLERPRKVQELSTGFA